MRSHEELHKEQEKLADLQENIGDFKDAYKVSFIPLVLAASTGVYFEMDWLAYFSIVLLLTPAWVLPKNSYNQRKAENKIAEIKQSFGLFNRVNEQQNNTEEQLENKLYCPSIN